MPHSHPMQDTDPHFGIDPETQSIIRIGTAQPVLVQGDHNSEIYTFDMPRYIDGHDMTECNKVRIHYINIGSSAINTSEDIWDVEDLQVAEDDDAFLCFTWPVSGHATRFVGSLNFAIHFSCITNDTVDYKWNTGTYKGIPVKETIECTDQIIEDNSDLLQQWENRLLNAIPEISLAEAENKVTISVKNINGETTSATLSGTVGPEGPKGENGVTPEFEIRDGRLIAIYPD